VLHRTDALAPGPRRASSAGLLSRRGCHLRSAARRLSRHDTGRPSRRVMIVTANQGPAGDRARPPCRPARCTVLDGRLRSRLSPPIRCPESTARSRSDLALSASFAQEVGFQHRHEPARNCGKTPMSSPRVSAAIAGDCPLLPASALDLAHREVQGASVSGDGGAEHDGSHRSQPIERDRPEAVPPQSRSAGRTQQWAAPLPTHPRRQLSSALVRAQACRG
jgi:hypothetical protein